MVKLEIEFDLFHFVMIVMMMMMMMIAYNGIHCVVLLLWSRLNARKKSYFPYWFKISCQNNEIESVSVKFISRENNTKCKRQKSDVQL
jgi:hypothetical protein